jgi:hypothetical protein
MKKLLTLGLALILISAMASAQKEPGDRFRRHRIERGFRHGQINRPERFQLRKDEFRYNMAQRNARRDGFVGPMEHRRLYKMRRHDRREAFLFRHNGRRRFI